MALGVGMGVVWLLVGWARWPWFREGRLREEGVTEFTHTSVQIGQTWD